MPQNSLGMGDRLSLIGGNGENGGVDLTVVCSLTLDTHLCVRALVSVFLEKHLFCCHEEYVSTAD